MESVVDYEMTRNWRDNLENGSIAGKRNGMILKNDKILKVTASWR